MPMVPAKCTQCGQNLQIDDTKEAAICPYCETPFITEKAINNYKFEIGSVVVEGVSVETKLNNAEVFFKMHGDTDKARELFEEVVDLAPADWRGWWGLVRISTQEFTRVRMGSELVAHIEENAKRAFNCARASDPEILSVIETQWNDFLVKVADWRKGHVERLSEKVSEKSAVEAEIAEKTKLMDEASSALLDVEEELRKSRVAKINPGIWVYIVTGLLSFYYGFGLIFFVPLVIRYFYLRNKEKKATERARELRFRRDSLSSDIYELRNKAEKQKEEIDKIEYTLKYTE